MRVVVLGERYSKNLGDGIICQCVEGLLRRNMADTDCVTCLDLSCRKDYNEKKTVQVQPFMQILCRVENKFLSFSFIKNRVRKKMGDTMYMYWTWERDDKKLVRMLSRQYPADIVVFAGGQLFKDYFLYYMKYFVSAYRNSKVYFNACGCDTLMPEYAAFEFRKILQRKNIAHVTMRSLQQSCQTILADDQYHFMPDPAICAADFFEESEKKEACIGLGIMAIVDLEEKKDKLLAFWGSIIKRLEEKKINYKLFCNGAEDDFSFLCEVAEYCDVKDADILPAPKNTNDLVSQITSFDRICSFRMHSIIVAYAFQIPFVGFAWDDKIKDFSRYTLTENQIVNWEEKNAESIIEKLLSCSIPVQRLNELKGMIYEEFKDGFKP